MAKHPLQHAPQRVFGAEDWQDEAACAHSVARATTIADKVAAGWDRYFTHDNLGMGARGKTEETKLTGTALCAVCPVRPQCLAYALEHKIRWGIWGGLTSQERIRLRRAERSAPDLAAPAAG